MTVVTRIADDLARECARAGQALTPRQHVVIASALGQWLEMVRMEGLGAGLEPGTVQDVEIKNT